MEALEIMFPAPKSTVDSVTRSDANEIVVDGEIIDLTEFADESRDGVTREVAATSLGNILLRLESESSALRGKYAQIEKMIADEYDYIDKQIERCKEFIRQVVPPQMVGLTNESIDIFYKETIETKIENEEQIPIEYCEVVTRPSKTAIKEALNEGKDVPGAFLKVNHHLQVKPGGKKAIANSKKRSTKRVENSPIPVALPDSVD